MPATNIGPLPAKAAGSARAVRRAERILGRAHKSVSGLFDAVDVLDRERRSANRSRRGRAAAAESDVLRSAVIFTGAGLDATMKTLVNDVARVLVPIQGSGARDIYSAFLAQKLAEGTPESLKKAILSPDSDAALLRYYLAERTKASFQGSGDLKSRVRGALGISSQAVPTSRLESLNHFFQVRNKIVHDMDLVNPLSSSVAREPRVAWVVARDCALVFDVAGELIRGAAAELQLHA